MAMAGTIVETDIFGAGQLIEVGSQVVVKGHGMGTVITVGCPTFGQLVAYHARIEGDREEICFAANHVKLYADIYEGLTDGWEVL